MSAQIVGSYTFYAEYDSENGRDMYSCALTDGEAIGFAAECVKSGDSPRVHVRRSGQYLAEVWAGYQKSVHVELHKDNGEVHQFELPCYANLAGLWIQRVHMS